MEGVTGQVGAGCYSRGQK